MAASIATEQFQHDIEKNMIFEAKPEKCCFIFEIKFCLFHGSHFFSFKFWEAEFGAKVLSFLEFVASNSRLACLGSHRMRAERVVAALLWFYKHDSGS